MTRGPNKPTPERFEPVIMRRTWAMPNACTFSIVPIGDFVRRWTEGRTCIVDPFARDNLAGATYKNDGWERIGELCRGGSVDQRTGRVARRKWVWAYPPPSKTRAVALGAADAHLASPLACSGQSA